MNVYSDQGYTLLLYQKNVYKVRSLPKERAYQSSANSAVELQNCSSEVQGTQRKGELGQPRWTVCVDDRV